jgi:hypothetical protein
VRDQERLGKEKKWKKMIDALQSLFTVEVLLFIVGFFASAFSTIAGFGAGIILISVSSFFMDVKTIIPISTTYFLAMSATQLIVFKTNVDWKTVKMFCAAAFPGILLGMWFFFLLPSDVIKKILAVLVLAYCVNAFLKITPKVEMTRKKMLPVAFIEGIADSITASGGTIQAPLFLSLGLRKEAFVASFAATSVILNPFKIGLYHYLGFLEFGNAFLIVILIVAGALGVQLGKLGLKYVSPENFRKIVLGFLFLVALRMLFF